MIQLENFFEYEYTDYSTLNTVMVMKATYRGHRIGVRATISPEAVRDLQTLQLMKETMLEELELQAARLCPSPPPPDDLDDIYGIMWGSAVQRQDRPREKVNWVREGF